jgi:DNA-binding NtrC family response regulator
MDSPTILLVEDDEGSRYAAEKELRRAGFRVHSAADTMQALGLTDKGLVPDCLVVDIGMPAGTPHGLSLANMLRLKNPNLLLMFVTGHPQAAEVVQDVPGPCAIFIKPVDFTALIGAIRDHLPAATGA